MQHQAILVVDDETLVRMCAVDCLVDRTSSRVSFIPKPYDPQTLYSRIEIVLESAPGFV